MSRPTATGEPVLQDGRRPVRPPPVRSPRSWQPLRACAGSTEASNPKSARRRSLRRSRSCRRRIGGSGGRSGPDTHRLRYRPVADDTENALDALRRHNVGTTPARPAAEPRCGSPIRSDGHREHRHSPNAGASPSRHPQRTRKILNYPRWCSSATRPAPSRKVRQIHASLSLDIRPRSVIPPRLLLKRPDQRRALRSSCVSHASKTDTVGHLPAGR